MPVTNKCDSFAHLSPAEAKSAKKLARNTWRYTRADGAECIRLHTTDIVARKKYGQEWQTTFDSGGWRTVTTKDRMNEVPQYLIYSDKGRWFVREQASGQVAEYFDGITLPLNFAPNPVTAEKVKAEETTLKQIAAYCDKVRKMNSLPIPHGGDCWICSMFNANQQPGAKSHDPEHLRSHIAEGYVHGSLIVNALKWAGFRDVGIAYWIQNYKSDKRRVLSTLRRYLKAQLGVGAL